jgi:hypothetical protein
MTCVNFPIASGNTTDLTLDADFCIMGLPENFE